MKNAQQYHGYLALPRHVKILREDLGFHLFNLYLSLVLEARWHRNNPQIGCVLGTQAEIATRLGISQSTLSRSIDALYAKNKYYVIKNKRYIRLGFFPLFLIDVARKMAKKDYATLHDLYADMYEINANLQRNYAKSQETHDQKHSQSLYSSFNNNLYSFHTDSYGSVDPENEEVPQ